MSETVGRYRFIEDIAIADCAIEVDGADLDDLFGTAATALAEIMVDPATVPITLERRVTLEAEEPDLLLYDWLAELILRKDRDREIFPVAEVRVGTGRPCTLVARVHGGAIDVERMALRNDPKAVTLHAFTLEQHAGGWRAQVVIDI
ncbi:MAG TPA: archease [Candidatus Eisenbacteria bacterium]|nr:archease [Candidatus Eisenbacteria bacterium]